jgi:hypothetical protein
MEENFEKAKYWAEVLAHGQRMCIRAQAELTACLGEEAMADLIQVDFTQEDEEYSPTA